MRTLLPNYDKEDGLETVLEVLIPEEMFVKMGSTAPLRWHNLRALMRAQSNSTDRSSSYLHAKSNNEFMALLKLVGSPLISFQIHLDNTLSRPIKDSSIGASTAKYIVQQFIAATGGQAAFSMVNSMYAVGQVTMTGSEMHHDNDSVHATGNCEAGGFVLWQKNPDLWCLELIVAGFKVSAGSNGKVAWNQSSSQPSIAHRGPPRPLRRFFQGLDPWGIAGLFSDAVCIAEETIDNEACFVLKVEAHASTLRAQSSPNTEIVHHTVWGYFSQRTGLLIKFEDTKLVRMKSMKGNDSVFWETTMASTIDDYKYIESLNIAHSGKTVTTLYRYGGEHNHKRKLEETWEIEEVDFNICGLSMEMFLPPAEVKREQNGGDPAMS